MKPDWQLNGTPEDIADAETMANRYDELKRQLHAAKNAEANREPDLRAQPGVTGSGGVVKRARLNSGPTPEKLNKKKVNLDTLPQEILRHILDFLPGKYGRPGVRLEGLSQVSQYIRRQTLAVTLSAWQATKWISQLTKNGELDEPHKIDAFKLILDGIERKKGIGLNNTDGTPVELTLLPQDIAHITEELATYLVTLPEDEQFQDAFDRLLGIVAPQPDYGRKGRALGRLADCISKLPEEVRISRFDSIAELIKNLKNPRDKTAAAECLIRSIEYLPESGEYTTSFDKAVSIYHAMAEDLEDKDRATASLVAGMRRISTIDDSQKFKRFEEMSEIVNSVIDAQEKYLAIGELSAAVSWLPSIGRTRIRGFQLVAGIIGRIEDQENRTSAINFLDDTMILSLGEAYKATAERIIEKLMEPGNSAGTSP